ncbi:TRAP transporter small permease [Massilia sp. TSP1-1-2]|uniref:TRAP transporter small permease n=1 Tax=Massilia sp. TSP1-1-2 TaxID=2804649 RepID=UPI003CFB20B2
MKILDHLEEWLIATLMGAATLVVFLAVVHRYLSGLAIPGVQDYLISLNTSWAQELCIFMFIWMAKFGAAYGARTGIHIGVDVLVNRMNARWRGRFIVFSLLAGAVFTGVIGTLGAYLIWHLSPDQTSEVLEIQMRFVYMCVPLGSGLMCFRFLQVMVNFIRTGDVPRHDVAHVEGLDDEINAARIGDKP